LVTLVAAAFCVPVLLFADVAFGEIFFSATLIHLPRQLWPCGLLDSFPWPILPLVSTRSMCRPSPPPM
jgi:hypothetical protein